MAGESANTQEVFRRSTMNRIASADELDHYIKVTNPNAWVVAIAALLLIAGIVVWAVIAIVPITINTTGITVVNDNLDEMRVACWVDKSTADKINDTGAEARIEGVEAKSVLVNSVPMSASEVIKILGSDFYAESLHLDDWNYLVTIEPGDALPQSDFTINTAGGESKLVPVSIIVAEKHPINIVLGKE